MSGLTRRSNSSALTRPDFTAASFRVVPFACAVFATFAALLADAPGEAAIAVDMPIGLPDRTGAGGRGPEALVRRHLGARQSSVFAIPSRAEPAHYKPGAH